MDKMIGFLSHHLWWAKSVATIVFGFLFSVIEIAVSKWLSSRFKKKGKLLSCSLVEALHIPLLLFIWFLVISIILQILIIHFKLNGAITQYFSKGRQVVGILFILWFFLRLIKKMETSIVKEKRFGRKEFADVTTVNALAQIIRVLVVVIVLLMLLQAIGQPIGTILAFGGIGGLAISFAAKDTLANFIGGLMLYWDRPFSVGDNVRCLDKGIDGIVEKIGWRLTTLRSYDKRSIYVPNAVFSSSAIENITRMTHRRIRTVIGLRYNDIEKLVAIEADIKAMLEKHPALDHNLSPTVSFQEFGASSLNMLIQAFTVSTDWNLFQQAQEEVLLNISEIVALHKADFAFPTTTVSIPDGIEFIQSEEGNHDSGQLQ